MLNLTRRAFLLTTTATLLPTSHATCDEKKKTPVVDTHLHCFAGKDDKRFPYHEKAPYRPESAAGPEHLLKCMAGANVDHAIVVHPEPYQDDHRYLHHCLEVGKGKLKGTCLVFADREGSVEQLPDLVKKGNIVAVRIHAYASDRLPPFEKPELRNLWKKAADLKLAVQLHLEPRYAPGFEAHIKEFSDTTAIIDHMGRPFQGSAKEHDVVVKWSRFKNTIMKLSAIPTPREKPDRDIASVINSLIDAYGADRLIYGGGFDANGTPESYAGERVRTASFLKDLSPENQAKILGGNAFKLFFA